MIGTHETPIDTPQQILEELEKDHPAPDKLLHTFRDTLGGLKDFLSQDHIVNLQIAVTRLETRWKLSQNRSRREQELIAAQLEQSADSAERALAALTRKHLTGE